MAPLHSEGKNNQNEVQHDLFGHVMPLALVLASHNVNDTGPAIILMPASSSIAPKHSLGQDKWNHMQLDFSGTVIPLALALHDCTEIGVKCHVMSLELASASCDADGITDDTIAFLRSRLSKWGETWLLFHHMTPRLSKWGETWLFWSYDTIGITWFQWQCQCHHWIP